MQYTVLIVFGSFLERIITGTVLLQVRILGVLTPVPQVRRALLVVLALETKGAPWRDG